MRVKVRKTMGSAGQKNRRQPAANCACDTGAGGRKAVGVDPGLKAANQNRLRRIEGQIRGLQKMVEEDRYCADIISFLECVGDPRDLHSFPTRRASATTGALAE